MYSSTYTAVIINVLAQVLPFLGISVGSEALTTTAQTLIAIVSGLWILKERFSKGGVGVFGNYTE